MQTGNSSIFFGSIEPEHGTGSLAARDSLSNPPRSHVQQLLPASPFALSGCTSPYGVMASGGDSGPAVPPCAAIAAKRSNSEEWRCVEPFLRSLCLRGRYGSGARVPDFAPHSRACARMRSSSSQAAAGLHQRPAANPDVADLGGLAGVGQLRGRIIDRLGIGRGQVQRHEVRGLAGSERPGFVVNAERPCAGQRGHFERRARGYGLGIARNRLGEQCRSSSPRAGRDRCLLAVLSVPRATLTPRSAAHQGAKAASPASVGLRTGHHRAASFGQHVDLRVLELLACTRTSGAR